MPCNAHQSSLLIGIPVGVFGRRHRGRGRDRPCGRPPTQIRLQNYRIRLLLRVFGLEALVGIGMQKPWEPVTIGRQSARIATSSSGGVERPTRCLLAIILLAKKIYPGNLR